MKNTGKWNNEDEYEDEELATAPSLSTSPDDEDIENAIEDNDDRELHPFNILVNNKSGLSDDLKPSIHVGVDDLLDVCDNIYPDTPWEDLPDINTELRFDNVFNDDYNNILLFTAHDAANDNTYILTIAIDEYDGAIITVSLQQLSGRMALQRQGDRITAIQLIDYQIYVCAMEKTANVYYMNPNPNENTTDYEFHLTEKV